MATSVFNSFLFTQVKRCLPHLLWGSLIFAPVLLIPSPPITAQAQPAFSDQQLQQFARAYLEIEALRTRLQREAESVEGMPQLIAQAQTQARERPDFSLCHDRTNELPPKGRQLCQTLATETTQIITRNDLDVSTFNAIVRSYPNDAAIQERVMRAINEQRRTASP